MPENKKTQRKMVLARPEDLETDEGIEAFIDALGITAPDEEPSTEKGPKDKASTKRRKKPQK